MKKIICKNQAEIDAVPEDFEGIVYVDFGTSWNKAQITKSGKMKYVAWEHSSVVAWGNSSIVAWGNVQVLDCTPNHKIFLNANARVVYSPKTLDEFIVYHGLKKEDGSVYFFKAVHKCKEKYLSDYNSKFEYAIGEEKVEPDCDKSIIETCGKGIHISTLDFALRFGRSWNDLAILECKAKKTDVILPEYSDGKCRASKIFVVREVPLEECGIYGKIIAKRMKGE